MGPQHGVGRGGERGEVGEDAAGADKACLLEQCEAGLLALGTVEDCVDPGVRRRLGGPACKEACEAARDGLAMGL